MYLLYHLSVHRNSRDLNVSNRLKSPYRITAKIFREFACAVCLLEYPIERVTLIVDPYLQYRVLISPVRNSHEMIENYLHNSLRIAKLYPGY